MPREEQIQHMVDVDVSLIPGLLVARLFVIKTPKILKGLQASFTLHLERAPSVRVLNVFITSKSMLCDVCMFLIKPRALQKP